VLFLAAVLAKPLASYLLSVGIIYGFYEMNTDGAAAIAIYVVLCDASGAAGTSTGIIQL